MNEPNQEALISLPPGVSAAALGEIEAAALVSGGIESAVMLGVLGAKLKRLYPIYMEFGLGWEKLEQRQLSLYLQALDCKQVAPLTVLSMPMQDVYKKHWGINGNDIPMSGTPDEAVYIPGRNLLMVAKASVWCTINQVKLIALGSLQTNPFADATDKFFATIESATYQALTDEIKVWRPFEHAQDRRSLARQTTASPVQPIVLTAPGGGGIRHRALWSMQQMRRATARICPSRIRRSNTICSPTIGWHALRRKNVSSHQRDSILLRTPVA